MNSVSLFGRLTRDPELRYTAQGKPVTGFTLAINRFGGNNEADFFDCTAWDKQAENISSSCKKGHRLLVWGRLQQEKWTDQQGQQRTSIKIIVSGFQFIEPAPQQQGPPAGPPQYQQGPPQYNQPPGYIPPQGGYQPPAGQYGPPAGPPQAGPPMGLGLQQGPPAGPPVGPQQYNYSDIPF